jgi:hypothetical protein
MSTCGHCRSQFEFFARDNIPSRGIHGLDVPIDIVPLSEPELAKLVDGGEITKRTMANKLEIVDAILPVEISSQVGDELRREADEWSRAIHDSSKRIEYTPTWLDFETHGYITNGHQVERWLRHYTNPNNSMTRVREFREMATKLTGQSCDIVGCNIDEASRAKVTENKLGEKRGGKQAK